MQGFFLGQRFLASSCHFTLKGSLKQTPKNIVFIPIRDRRPPAGGGEGRDGHLGPGRLVAAGGVCGQNHHVLRVDLRPLRHEQRGDIPPRQTVQR